MVAPVLNFRALSKSETDSPLSSMIAGLLGGYRNAQELNARAQEAKQRELGLQSMLAQMEEQKTRQKYLEPTLQAQMALEQGRASALPEQLRRQKEKEDLDLILGRAKAQYEPQRFEQESDYNKARQRQIEEETKYYPEKAKAEISKLTREGQPVDELTKSNITKNQGIVQSIDSVLPLIKSIKPSESPGRLFGKYINPNEEAAYSSKTSTITDVLLGALGLPKTDSSIDLINKMIVRGKGETDKAYQKRLDTLVRDLQDRRKQSMEFLKQGLPKSENLNKFDVSKMSDEELIKIAGI